MKLGVKEKFQLQERNSLAMMVIESYFHEKIKKTKTQCKYWLFILAIVQGSIFYLTQHVKKYASKKVQMNINKLGYLRGKVILAFIVFLILH